MSEVLAYSLKLPDGRLVAASAAEPDGIIDIVASIYGVTPEHLKKSFSDRGGSVVKVRLIEVQDAD